MSDGPLAYLVDDDESFLTALSRLLRAEGIETRCFAAAAVLLDSLDRNSRRCVVADLEMPEVSGFELQQRLMGRPHPCPSCS